MLMILLLLFYFLLILFVSIFLYFINYLFMMNKMYDFEKLSVFECGFSCFNISRLPFSIHFYMIGVLFLIFDVEIVLMFPMIYSLNFLNYYYWFLVSLLILLILYLGLEFEKYEGCLQWMI